jgi:hypothetical protein
MIKATDSRPFWESLLRSILIFTTFSSGLPVAASDLIPGKSAQLSTRDSRTETRTFLRRAATTAPITSTRAREQAVSAQWDPEATVLVISPSDEISHQDLEFRMAGTSFGVGNFAASALGRNASI